VVGSDGLYYLPPPPPPPAPAPAPGGCALGFSCALLYINPLHNKKCRYWFNIAGTKVIS
jgi:hypothetical protein